MRILEQPTQSFYYRSVDANDLPRIQERFEHYFAGSIRWNPENDEDIQHNRGIVAHFCGKFAGVGLYKEAGEGESRVRKHFETAYALVQNPQAPQALFNEYCKLNGRSVVPRLAVYSHPQISLDKKVPINDRDSFLSFMFIPGAGSQNLEVGAELLTRRINHVASLGATAILAHCIQDNSLFDTSRWFTTKPSDFKLRDASNDSLYQVGLQRLQTLRLYHNKGFKPLSYESHVHLDGSGQFRMIKFLR